MRPWPCTQAVVRGSSAQRSPFKPYKTLLFALGSGCALPTEISTTTLVGLGIYGEANSVTDTTVPL